MLRVVTSGHVTKMAVTPFDLPLPKTHSTRKLHGFVFYRTGVIAEVIHSGNGDFLTLFAPVTLTLT